MSITQRSLPSLTQDNISRDFSCDSYGRLKIANYFYGSLASADEGQVFMGVNPTIGTGVSASVATQYSATASAYVSLRNSDTGTDGSGTAKRVIPLYMRFITVTAPASATAWSGVLEIDNVLSRFTNGGSSITPVNPNMVKSSTGIGKLDVGALTTVALSSSGRSLSRIRFRPVIPVAGDSYTIVFGAPESPEANDVVNGSNPCHASFLAPPIVLGPQHCMTLSVFGASNSITGWATEFEVVWLEV